MSYAVALQPYDATLLMPAFYVTLFHAMRVIVIYKPYALFAMQD